MCAQIGVANNTPLAPYYLLAKQHFSRVTKTRTHRPDKEGAPQQSYVHRCIYN